jgi:hypothetical protein
LRHDAHAGSQSAGAGDSRNPRERCRGLSPPPPGRGAAPGCDA